jgi:hypothetical protein
MNIVDEELVFVHNRNKNQYVVFGKNGVSFMFRDWIVSRRFGIIGRIEYDQTKKEWYFEKNTMLVGSISFTQDTLKQIHDCLEQLNIREDVSC